MVAESIVEEYDVVVVGGGLAGHSLAKAFSDHHKKVLTVDAHPKPEVEEIGSEKSSAYSASFGTWQRLVAVTGEPELAKRSREIYEELGKSSGLEVLTPRWQITLGTSDAPGTVIDIHKKMAEEMGVPWVPIDAADHPDELSPLHHYMAMVTPDLGHINQYRGFAETPETGGIIHMNRAMEAMRQHVTKQNPKNEFVHGIELNQKNTRADPEHQRWIITLGDRTIHAKHLAIAPGAKGIMDLATGKKDALQYFKKKDAQNLFSPKRAPAFMVEFPNGHNLPDVTFLNPENDMDTDVMYAHPDGKHVYFARFSDPANPLTSLMMRYGGDKITELDRFLFFDRLRTLSPKVQLAIAKGEANVVAEQVYRYTMSASGKPVSEMLDIDGGTVVEDWPGAWSVLVAGQGGWAKKFPAMAEEHARKVMQVLEPEKEHSLHYPQIMEKCTLQACREAHHAANRKKRKLQDRTADSGRRRSHLAAVLGKDTITKDGVVDIYSLERMLNELLIIKKNKEGAVEVDDTLVQDFMCGLFDGTNPMRHMMDNSMGIALTSKEKDFVARIMDDLERDGGMTCLNPFGDMNHLEYSSDLLSIYGKMRRRKSLQEEDIQKGEVYFEFFEMVGNNLKHRIFSKNLGGVNLEGIEDYEDYHEHLYENEGINLAKVGEYVQGIYATECLLEAAKKRKKEIDGHSGSSAGSSKFG